MCCLVALVVLLCNCHYPYRIVPQPSHHLVYQSPANHISFNALMEPQSTSGLHSGCFDSVFFGLQPSSTTSIVENASSSSTECWSMTTDNEHDTAETPSSVVRLRGLPYSADSEAVRAFFAPTELAEVYFCRR